MISQQLQNFLGLYNDPFWLPNEKSTWMLEPCNPCNPAVICGDSWIARDQLHLAWSTVSCLPQVANEWPRFRAEPLKKTNIDNAIVLWVQDLLDTTGYYSLHFHAYLVLSQDDLNVHRFSNIETWPMLSLAARDVGPLTVECWCLRSCSCIGSRKSVAYLPP